MLAESAAVPLLETDLPGLPKRRGKVRDVYDLGDDRLLIVATDRISAFDWVLPTPIPDKGRVLTALSDWWFDELKTADHRISSGLDAAGLDLSPDLRESLAGRVVIARKARVVPFECVMRGYLAGSGWKEYRESGTVCGGRLPPGLVESSWIEPDPIFTPASKAETGHDENMSFGQMEKAIGTELAVYLREQSWAMFEHAATVAFARGLILADTKFEFGFVSDCKMPVLIDEVLTPDSSRYWIADQYKPGGPQPSYDKQFLRDYLETTGWDKQSPPPPLPDEIVAQTRAKYIECFETLTGKTFAWK